jgi:hypothetical protein
MKPTLIETHFQRGKVMLPGIDEEIDLPNGILFRNEGEVRSLIRSMAITRLILKGQILAPGSVSDKILDPLLNEVFIWLEKDKIRLKHPDSDLDNDLGYSLRHETGTGVVAYSIAIVKGLEKSKKQFALGHESGHAVDKLSQRHVIQQLLDQRGILLDSSQHQGEDFADIGGLLALKKLQERGEADIRLPVFKTRERVKDVLLKPFNFEYPKQ